MKNAEEREQQILDLLHRDWEKGPLVIEAETAVEIRLALMDNRAMRQQIGHLRRVMAEMAPLIRQLWDAALKHVMPAWVMLAPYLEQDAPMGAEWAVKVQAGYGTDAEPEPRMGDRGTCRVCGGEIEYVQETPLMGAHGPDHVLNSWWSHLAHPEDGHQARLGGPA